MLHQPVISPLNFVTPLTEGAHLNQPPPHLKLQYQYIHVCPYQRQILIQPYINGDAMHTYINLKKLRAHKLVPL